MKNFIMIIGLCLGLNGFSQNALNVQNNTSNDIVIQVVPTYLANPNNIGSNVLLSAPLTRVIPANSTVTILGVSSNPTARWFYARMYSPMTRSYAVSYYDSFLNLRNTSQGITANWISNFSLIIN